MGEQAGVVLYTYADFQPDGLLYVSTPGDLVYTDSCVQYMYIDICTVCV